MAQWNAVAQLVSSWSLIKDCAAAEDSSVATFAVPPSRAATWMTSWNCGLPIDSSGNPAFVLNRNSYSPKTVAAPQLSLYLHLQVKAG
jgi:hypothetical protein